MKKKKIFALLLCSVLLIGSVFTVASSAGFGSGIAVVAAEEGYIKPEDVAKLIAFRNNPSDESWIGGVR